MQYTPVHEVLRNKRINLKIGLRQVSDALHVSSSSISRWERGMCFMPEFGSLYQQFLHDCENGKVIYKKSHRVGVNVRSAPKPYYSTNDFGDPQLNLPIPDDEGTNCSKINHPKHYPAKIEVIDFIDSLNLNFNLGNVLKYISRAGRKDGEDTLTALKKAQWYLNREIQRLEDSK